LTYTTYLPVLAGGQVGDLGKEVEIQLAIEALATVVGRPAGETVADAPQAGDGDQAVAGAAGREAAVGLRVAAGTIVVAAGDGGWLDGGAWGLEVAVGAQDGGHVHGTNVAGVMRLRGGGRRVVWVAEVRCAERRDLGSGRDLVGLRAAVVHAGTVLRDKVVRELLVPGQDRHNQVGSHGRGCRRVRFAKYYGVESDLWFVVVVVVEARRVYVL
jgi:hypothetical protein